MVFRLFLGLLTVCALFTAAPLAFFGEDWAQRGLGIVVSLLCFAWFAVDRRKEQHRQLAMLRKVASESPQCTCSAVHSS